MESNKSKSRGLTPFQFFQILQVEWIVADLRSRIYPQKSDKDYWNKVKEGKQKVIESIAEKNFLPTIFTDEEMRRIFERKVYVDKGLPNFSYKDEQQKSIQEPQDLAYYYKQGSEVRFDVFGEQKIGKIKSYTLFEDQLFVEYPNDADESGNSTITHSIATKEVTRIL